MRVVFDTVILVRGLISPYGPWGRLVFQHAHRYRLVVSPQAVVEYVEVIQRPELTRKYRSVATRDPHAMLDWLSRAEVVELAEIPVVSLDTKDDPFLETARVGKVDYLVSEDRHLLDLIEHHGIPIIPAQDFVVALGPEDHPVTRQERE